MNGLSRTLRNATLHSAVVPTEYDVEAGCWPYRFLLSDDRGRIFGGYTLKQAWRRAEHAQDPTDPIHHPPYPDPTTVASPRKHRRARSARHRKGSPRS